MMMKLSVLLLLALQTAGLLSKDLDIGNNTEDIDDGEPEINANQSMPADVLLGVANLSPNAQVQTSVYTANVGTVLEWVTWNNFLPSNSVSIDNRYVDRIDYVCKYKCNAGFYNPDMGPHCHYPSAGNTHLGYPFEVLVNKDNFEILEWKDDSYGSVPKNSVRICPGQDVYVGKDEYGLGEVITQDEYFYLPWKSTVYIYHYYQVLTINKNVVSQRIYDVKYNTGNSKILNYPPEPVRETSIKNYECHPVVTTATLSTTMEVEHRWDIGFSIEVGVTTTIKAGIPLFFSTGVTISTEGTFKFSRQNTVVKSSTETISVQLTAPPNSSCMARMVEYKYKISIPFTAFITRTYANGETRTMPITGTYDSVQVKEVQALTKRCQPLMDPEPC
ncbi:natterin-4-like [Scomber japonicus]|uniref:natterin-4-like n=1 Tax=Scomber japonicus TaxID=13676 RepID=UPI0023066D1D|nr:natterin-4-like [Scomber japonicus]